MSTKLCERCKRRIKADAVSCICGWSLTMSRPTMPERKHEPLPSWEESRNAYKAVRERIFAKMENRVWTRERFIEHYLKMIANPEAAGWAKQHATEALRNLGYVAPQEREPGSDDEPALGIPLDELEQEFADAAQP